MSTMLRSAAMTLLSKTLLTFLYKYLSDVDVEGVEMPSLYGSSEGTGSGWGVRLSNVKLREGAELMQLPGGRKTKAKKAKPENDNEEENNSTEQSEEDHDWSNDATEKFGGRRQNGDSDIMRPSGHGSASPRDNDPETLYVNTHDKHLVNGDRDKVESGHRTSPSHDSHVEELEYIQSLEDSDAGSIGSIENGTRPETPVQESSFSFLTCFAPGTDPKSKGNHAEQEGQEQESHHNTTDTFSYGVHDGGNYHHYQQQQYQNGHEPLAHASAQEEMDVQLRKDSSRNAPTASFNSNHRPNSDDASACKRQENEGDRAQENSEEEVEESTPMVLRIGEGGYIGTLDVRLIGRELHVLVEDAYLTLEAVTKGGTADEEAAAKVAAEQQNETANVPGDPPEKKSAPANVPPAPKELKTTGERVLAENAIARIFSSVPHLLLRDIRVRLVVRDDSDSYQPADGADEETAENTNEDTAFDNADVVVDMGIELLSVTEGEDFLSPFHTEYTKMDDEEQPPEPDSPGLRRRRSSRSDSTSENEYLERRIRTGKGSDGGIWINVVTPKIDQNPYLKRYNSIPESVPQHGVWARNAWLESTRYCMFRCSGLDINARIFLGTRKELAQANASYLWSFDDSESYQGIDHTLYGFDHVVPGPTPHTLPPLLPHGPIGGACRSIDEEDDNGHLLSQVYKTDRNGVQSSRIASCFHRIARDMMPTRCTVEHLPCENCCKCWEVSAKRSLEKVTEKHPLDSYTPMPGLALSISIRDPLELNADRLSLDGLGLVIDLFKKKKEGEDLTEQDKEIPTEEDQAVDSTLDEKEATDEAPKSTFSSYFFGSRKTNAESKEGQFGGLLSSRQSKKEEPPAFPSYMKPESIQILGVDVAKMNLRVQVMHQDDEKRHNSGLSFCYWDIRAECLTLDQQTLKAKEKKLQDLRLDMAIFEVHEYKGVDRKVLITSGVPFPKEGDLVSLASLKLHSDSSRPPWPTTACALLDVPPAIESLIYESRERHGIQLRYLQAIDKPGTFTEKIRSLVNCQIGPAEVNLPWPIKQTIFEIKDEAKKALLGVNKEDEVPDPPVEEEDKVMQYRAQLGGGRVRLKNLIDVRLPLTRLAGNICPESGFSIETLLEHVDMSFGQSSQKLTPTANAATGFPLKKVLTLPEKVRLRILIFLDELDPLEKALGLKRHSSPFLRCNAVNKGLSQLSARKSNHRKMHRKKAEADSNKKLNRRQELINKLLTLDDEALENLWATHSKKQKKAKKTAATKNNSSLNATSSLH